jgi:hypothetical protein
VTPIISTPPPRHLCGPFLTRYFAPAFSQHEEVEAAFAKERVQRVPEQARAASDMMKFQDTPNPNSLKFIPGCPVLGVGGGTLDLATARAAMVFRNPPNASHALYIIILDFATGVASRQSNIPHRRRSRFVA